MDPDVDIDYQNIRVKEEVLDNTDLEENIFKIRSIIRKEFMREQIERENDVMQIQEQILATQKCIKVLKYVEACRMFQDDVKFSSEESNLETAIHPCVQQLLPNKSKVSKLVQNPTPDTGNQLEEALAQKPEKQVTLVRGTYRIRHTLIFGNVSKWIPLEERGDEATHKWMLYIRDKERDEQLSMLIDKIRYFLHDSYKPNDIIDVSTPPFYLTRRGWGEFNVRVIIFFKHPGNKPIDFIHPLKLDDTCSGQQTLGRETVLELDLMHDNISDYLPDKMITEDVDDKLSCNTPCDIIALEHNYSSTVGNISSENYRKPIFQPQQISSSSNNTSHVSEYSILQSWNASVNKNIVKWYKSNVLNRLSSIYFLSTEACVKWFLTRWPLITPYAQDQNYKTVHPYSFASLKDYFESNVGKRHAAEWFRSYEIKQFLIHLNLHPWSTKQIFMYSRMFCYALVLGPSYNSPLAPMYKNISTYTSHIDISSDFRYIEPPVCDEIDIINAETVKNPTTKKCGKIVYVSSELSRFVERASKDLGIKLGIEEVVESYHTNLATQILCHTLKLFLNDLLRKSSANAWQRNSCKKPEFIDVSDILKTLCETPEFDIFTNSGLGTNNTNI